MGDEVREGLARRFRRQAAGCAALGSPLTATLLSAAAEDISTGGVVGELFVHEDQPRGSVPALRFAGALHRLVLAREAPELATYYPSVGGTAPADRLWPVARAVVEARREDLAGLVRRPVQTNEVGRSAALFGALAMAASAFELPVRLLELGASAGLNLHPDRFAYEIDAHDVRGDARSAVRLSHPWTGRRPPDAPVHVVERLGCDPRPVDVTTTDGRLTLTSFVWPDQRQRIERLRAAMKLAAQHPTPVRRETATELLRRDGRPREGTVTVVWHSVVMQYVDPAERESLPEAVADLGALATSRAPFVHLAFEPEEEGGELPFRLRARTWPAGEDLHLADAAGHGPPVRWTGARIAAGR